jgi:hypothetical protein
MKDEQTTETQDERPDERPDEELLVKRDTGGERHPDQERQGVLPPLQSAQPASIQPLERVQ